jgi:hypothetical protein
MITVRMDQSYSLFVVVYQMDEEEEEEKERWVGKTCANECYQ